MDDFFKYLTPGEEDKNWSIYLNVAGKATIAPNTIYPSREHPTGYYFTWKKGRMLEEYQLVYITEGGGILKNDKGTFNIKAGTIMLIRPGELHRYRPEMKTGWVENYIGFNGKLVNHFYEQAAFLNTQPLFYCGIRESYLVSYYKIFKLAQEEKPGFQQIASGLILQLLGMMVAHQKQGDFSGKPIATIIQKVLLEMRQKVESNIGLQELANRHHISYANFRKMFKKYTGVSPRQYHLELKLIRAKELLLTSEKSVKEISQELHFESIHYFSRYFKKRMGCSPTQMRNNTL
ncbi:MAG: transcriptional regulator [Saprospiraceae bacterium]|nr:MAG: transcriptional regulator [Saprospiraceae bacterium]